jgi:hypothetical protein
MDITADSQGGTPGQPNEDWFGCTGNMMVVLDGATVRTDTGCLHDVAWYVAQLGHEILNCAPWATDLPLVLKNAIGNVNEEHRDTCDLTHPGTPSAAVAIVRYSEHGLRYLVLGDVSLALDTTDGVQVIVDHRISQTASAERAVVDAMLVDDPARPAALLAMKRAELAARNTSDGYWIAAAEPTAADHALVGGITGQWTRLAMLTDGAERAISMFGLHTWAGLLDRLQAAGPGDVIRHVRWHESSDPRAARYPRNKVCDDATIVFAQPSRAAAPRHPVDPERSRQAVAAIRREFPATDPAVVTRTLVPGR